MHPDAELVSSLQRHHLSLGGRAQAGSRRRRVLQVTVGLHHGFGLRLLAGPQPDLDGHHLRGVAPGEGDLGVNVVLTGLQDSQPGVLVVADAPEKRVFNVPQEEPRWRDTVRGEDDIIGNI